MAVSSAAAARPVLPHRGGAHGPRHGPRLRRARLAPTAAQRDEEERFDRSLFTGMAEIGLAGLPYPEQYGGAGMGSFAWAVALEEIAAADMGMAVSLSVHILAQLPHPLLRDR